MNIKGTLLAAAVTFGIGGVFAQSIEHDDMYFNADDRAALRAKRTSEMAMVNTKTASKFDEYKGEDERINPTDSYSARNVNPEFTARAQTRAAQADEEDYFVNNYQYNRNQFNNWNNNFNSWYGSSWYRPNYFGPGINTWNSPYYGYNRFGSPWYDPYWSYNGWSSSFAFHYGRSWNYGWGGNYNYWNRPYYGFGWDPFYAGMYGGGYWNNFYHPNTVIVVNGDRGGKGVVYGKRPTRSSAIVSDRSQTRSRSSVVNSVRDDQNSGGRLSNSGTRQEDYYNRYNRTRSNSNATYDNRSNTQQNRARSWGNDSWNNSSYDNNRSMNRSSSPSYSPSRSSGSDSGTRTNSGSGSSGRRGRD